MKIKFTLHRSGRAPIDLVATVDAATTVGDLAAYLARAEPGTTVAPDLDGLSIGVVGSDTRTLDPRTALADSGLRSGATVSLTRSGEAYRDPQRGAAATVIIVEGPDRGREFGIHAGISVIGRERGCEIRLTDPLVSRQHARVTVTDTVEVVDLGSANGLMLADATVARSVLRPGDIVRLGDTALTVRLLQGAHSTPGIESGTVSFVRPPRLEPIYSGTTFEAPEVPERPGRQRFPLTPLLAPLLMGPLLYYVTKSATSLIFIGLSPLMLIGSAIESRIAGKSAFKKALKQWRADVAGLVEDATEAAATEASVRNREHPPLSACLEAARQANPLLWTRRPGEQGFVELKLGNGRQLSRNHIELADAKRAPRELMKELHAAVDGFVYVDGVPVIARPGLLGSIGLAGPRSTMLAAARALLAQAAVLHSPAELVITGLASSQSAKDWDWLKWLPHTTSSHSPSPVRQLASTGPTATKLISELEDLLVQRGADDDAVLPAVLLLVEHDAPVEHSRLVDMAERGWRHGVYLVWLAPDVSQLPAACRTFVEVTHETPLGAVGFVHSGEHVAPTTVELLEAMTALDLARRLAPVVDIGARVADDSDLPRAVSLLTITGTSLASSPEAVIERWSENRSILTGPFAPKLPTRHAGSLRAVIGQGAGEPLALDLRADGPHALVGGTTGSGKSELLQAWILAMAAAHSPQRLSFLLVDYKGGSAFRDCTNLPHTIGLVTDLSPHLVRRALTSLSAVLRYREHVLAKHGAKDLMTLERMGVSDAPPSLVIVVDEFAALVNEVPEFVDGVVNVAQRGRSLGLHLILATQRPAGVIKDNLRANTNLRLALRMADEADSTDVLGSPEAAFFDQAIPGRAVSKTGPGRLVPFQTGYAGGWTTDEAPPPELLVEELSFGQGATWEPDDDTTVAVSEQGETDIQRIVTSIGSASLMAQIPMPRKPWLPELKVVYDLADQSEVPSRRSDTELVFGVRDDPDNQAQPTVAFYPDRDGNLAVYGTGGSGKSTLLRSLAVAAGFTVRGGPCHVYGIDFGARGLSMLEDLPHVGSIIAGSDHERITRLLGWLRALVDERALRYSRVNAGTVTDYRRLTNAPDEPRILLLVDGIAAFRQAYEATDRIRWFETFTSLAADGRPVGIHVILSSDQRAGMTTALASAVQARVVLRLASEDDYGLLGVAKDVVSGASPAGRGIFSDAETQVAVLGGTSDVVSQAVAIRAFGESMRRANATVATAIERLPEKVLVSRLPKSALGLPVVGMSSGTLGPFTIEPRGSFIVSGPPGSGRTTTLIALAQAHQSWNPQTRLHYFGSRRSPLAALAGWSSCALGGSEVAESAATLAAQVSRMQPADPPYALFVENVGEFVSGPADSPLQDLARACLAQDQFLVVEGVTSSVSGSFGFLGLAKSSRAGIALAPDQGDGSSVYRTNFPRTNRVDFPPGRALYVALGKTEVVQVGYPDIDET